MEPSPRSSRFAVPLDALVGDSQVGLTEQVEVHAVPPPAAWEPPGLRVADGGGGDADGD